MWVFIFTINIVDGEKEDQFNGSPPRPQPRGPRTPPGPPPPDDDEDEPMPVSGRMTTGFVLSAVPLLSGGRILFPVLWGFLSAVTAAGQIPLEGRDLKENLYDTLHCINLKDNRFKNISYWSMHIDYSVHILYKFSVGCCLLSFHCISACSVCCTVGSVQMKSAKNSLHTSCTALLN